MYNQDIWIEFRDKNRATICFKEVESLLTGDFLVILGRKNKYVFRLEDVDKYSVESRIEPLKITRNDIEIQRGIIK